MGDKPTDSLAETAQQKSARLKALREQAEREKRVRVDRDMRKAAARKKVLG